jgi:hypothetical protein
MVKSRKPKTYMRTGGQVGEIAARAAAAESGPVGSYLAGRLGNKVGRRVGRGIRR